MNKKVFGKLPSKMFAVGHLTCDIRQLIAEYIIIEYYCNSSL